MERDASSLTQRRDEIRGTGGKLRRPPARKPPSTPYARPASRAAGAGDDQRRWLSRLVDPARRLVSGGASLIFPSYFSNPPALEDCDDHDEPEKETEDQYDASDVQNCNSNHEKSRAIGEEGPISTVEVSEAVPDLVRQKQETMHDLPDEKSVAEPAEKGISDVEHLLKGKSFSREEVNRLMNIINSRAVEVPNTAQEKKYQCLTPGDSKGPVTPYERADIISENKQRDSNESLWKASTQENKNQSLTSGYSKGPVTPYERTDIISENKRRDLNESLWKVSTPLHQSAMLAEVTASPADIGRAYMRSRRESGNFSRAAMTPKDERSSFYGPDSGSKPTIPSSSPKPSVQWPGSMVQDQRDYFTPQPQRARYGLQNFPRTPYSRTIFSKSKSKVTPQLQGGTDVWHRHSSATRKVETPIFGQNSRSEKLEADYTSIGPIRRSRHKLGSQSPFNAPTSSGASKGFLPTPIKNFETRQSSSGSQFQPANSKSHGFESSVPDVHPQTSRIARTILDHLDRNPPTPKEKSEELKLATEWKKSSSSTTPFLDPNPPRKTAQENADKSISLYGAPRWDGFLSNGRDGVSQTKSSHEAGSTSQALNLQKKPPTSGNKPVLSSIFIDKPVSNWNVSSSQSSDGFTFPVSTNSGGAFSEPPTPSITPSVPDKAQQKQKPRDGLDVPTYTFGSTKSEPALVFSFPSASSSGVQTENSDIKFCFGSDKPRLSFSSVGKDGICY